MYDRNEVQNDLTLSTSIGQELENLVVQRVRLEMKQGDIDRAKLIVGYWSLVFDYQKSILALLGHELYGGAFALLRPMVEATMRAHVAISCRPGVVQTLKLDTYKFNFKEVGPHLDKQFRMGGFFERLMKRAEATLHSFTHSGAAQVSRRFVGADVTPDFSRAEINEAMSGATAMAFMVTALTTKYFGLENEWAAANKIYRKAKHLSPSHTKHARKNPVTASSRG